MLIGVDVGGTKVSAVAIDDSAETPRILATARAAMPGRDVAETVLDDVVSDCVLTVAARAGDSKIAGVGIAAAGLVDRAREAFRSGAHLPWRDSAVRERFSVRLELPVVLDNDVNCAAYAESWAGSAVGAEVALLVTVGTGIGGALLVDGRVLRGANGMAGEFGHMRFVPGGLGCECGLHGCWEQYCSGRALERAFQDIAGRELPGIEITRLAQTGDRAAAEAVTLIGTRLGVGLAGLTAAFDPEVIVVGGGVATAGELLLQPARESLRGGTQSADRRVIPPVRLTRFGAESAAIGAALLAGGRHP